MEKKTHIPGRIGDSSSLLRQVEQGSVEVERGAQLTIGFEKRLRVRTLTCYLKTIQRKKTQRARWVRGRIWNSERVEGRGPRYDLCVGSWNDDRNRPMVKVKKQNDKKTAGLI